MTYTKQIPKSSKDFEVEDVEEYKTEDTVFSHQVLVMQAMRKCIELGSKELIEGFYDETQTDQAGVIKIVYKEDTRRAYIEAVKSAEGIMCCDFDTKIKTNLRILKNNLRKITKRILAEQKEWYEAADYKWQQENPTDVRYFNAGNPNLQFFWNGFIDRELENYRGRFQQLSKLTKRLKFYKGKEFET